MSTVDLTYELIGEKHIIKTNNDALKELVIDTTGIPPERRHGTSRLLLASSTIMCFCGTLVEAMETRNIEYSSLKAKASTTEVKNENNVDRVGQICIEVEVEVAEKFKTDLEKIKKIMRKGCFITSSVHEGIDMKYKINDSELN